MAVARQLRFVAQAERDLRQILRWTAEHFGVSQSQIYRTTIFAALEELAQNPEPVGVRDGSHILPGLKFYHVAHRKRSGRHVIFFRFAEWKGEEFVVVLRILHDSMDFKRHVSDESSD
jgi:toxin ParE1/3/4